MPVTFLVLLIAFGAFVAAGVPVLLAFSGVLGSLGIAAAPATSFHSSDATKSVMLLIGMAVGVDYSLFYLKREREERRRGARRATRCACGRHLGPRGADLGRTVMIAMAGMLFAGNKVFSSMGIGAMIMVFAAMVGSLTVLPAVLGKLGRPRGQGFGRTLLRRVKGERSRGPGAVLARALRFPAVSAALAGGALLVMASPVLGMHMKLLSFTDLPQNMQIVKSYEKVQKQFPGAQIPAVVVVRRDDVRAPEVRQAIASLERGRSPATRCSARSRPR